MADKNDIILAMFQEHYTHSRQHESQRSTVTSILISISAALVALVSLDKSINKSDVPLGLFLVGVGIFGSLFCTKLYERFRLHMQHVKIYRKELERMVPESKVDELHWKAEEKHIKVAKFNIIPLNKLWIFLHLFIAFLGLFIVLMGITS